MASIYKFEIFRFFSSLLKWIHYFSNFTKQLPCIFFFFFYKVLSKIVLWDGCSKSHKITFEILDWTLTTINEPFGLQWFQSRYLRSCLKSSHLWKNAKKQMCKLAFTKRNTHLFFWVFLLQKADWRNSCSWSALWHQSWIPYKNTHIYIISKQT